MKCNCNRYLNSAHYGEANKKQPMSLEDKKKVNKKVSNLLTTSMIISAMNNNKYYF